MRHSVLLEDDWVLAPVAQNFSLDLSSCGAESFILGRDMSGVAGQVLFFEICRFGQGGHCDDIGYM